MNSMSEANVDILDHPSNTTESVDTNPQLRLRLPKIGSAIKRLLAPPTYPSIYDQARDMLPSTVNLAANAGADLRKDHIDAVNKHGLVDASMYLTLQVLDGSTKEQQAFLEEYVNEALHDNDPSNFQKIVGMQIENLPPDTTLPFAKGKKLKQLNQMGFETWTSQFGAMAEKAHKEKGDASPVVLAYAGMMGLRKLLKEYQGTGIDIYAMNDPVFSTDADNPYSGYKINTSPDAETKVELLPKGFEKPSNFYLIDDTKQEGQHLERVWNMMHTNDQVPLTDSDYYVVQTNNFRGR